MSRLRRSWFGRVFAAVLAAVLSMVVFASPAQAEGEDWAITRYAMEVELGEDGAAKINLEFDFNFGNDAGHGPFLILPSRQAIPDDSEHWRSFPIDVGDVSSPTGAPTDVETDTQNGLLAIKIGDEDKEIEGLHTYRVNYAIRGLINPEATGSGLDELNWNVISSWEVPLRNISITVTGPADIDQVTCFAGPAESQQECKSIDSGASSTFEADEVAAGDGMTIVAGWPGGTFVGAEPILTRRRHLGNTFTPNPLTIGGGALIALLGTGGLIALARRHGRDERYAGVAPGLTPTPGSEETVITGSGGPVAVRFTPPDDARPGEIGALLKENARPEEITATTIDLAVRGHLRISEVPAQTVARAMGRKDWELERLKPADDLLPYEDAVLTGLFGTEQRTKMSEVATKLTQAKVPQKLLDRVTERSWFQKNPGQVRSAWYGFAILTVILGIGLTVLLAITLGWGIIGLGVVLLGIIGFFFAGRMPARTADGTAVLDQAKGFRLYLETAEADQLRFEEGEDLFSRYLPYAIVFGVTERWAKIFADLVAQGRDVPAPSWYAGAYVGAAAFYGSGGFTDSLSSFTSATSSAMTASSSGSGGGSGFGGGGGVGGGVGGGGGGGW